MLAEHLQKQRKNTRLRRNRRLQIYLLERTKLGVLSTWHGLGAYKDLPRRTASGNVLLGKTFKCASNPKCEGYQQGLASIVYNFFDKKLLFAKEQEFTKDFLPQFLRINNWSMNYTSQSLEHLKNVKYLSQLTFGVLIVHICNWEANTITKLHSCSVLLIFTANILGSSAEGQKRYFNY